jgi:hypothetical protein
MEHMKSPIPSLQAARKDVPAALDAVFNRMLAKVSADRQANMAQVIAELNAAVKGTAAPATAAAADTKGSASFPLLAIVASLLVGIGLGFAVGKFL